MRPGLAARVLPLVGALAACGDESGSTDRTGADVGIDMPSSDVDLPDHDPDRVGVESDLPLGAACALLTVGHLSVIFGEAVGEGQPREDPLGGVSCKSANAAGDLEVEVVRRVRRRPEAIMEAARQSWSIDGVVDLDGIGDDAFYNADPGGLPGSEVVIRSGNEIIRARLLLPERLLTQGELDPYYAGIARAIGELL